MVCYNHKGPYNKGAGSESRAMWMCEKEVMSQGMRRV